MDRNEWLAPKDKIGPEFGIGCAMGHVFDEPVLVLKACIGNLALGWREADVSPANQGYHYNHNAEKYYEPANASAGPWRNS